MVINGRLFFHYYTYSIVVYIIFFCIFFASIDELTSMNEWVNGWRYLDFFPSPLNSSSVFIFILFYTLLVLCIMVRILYFSRQKQKKRRKKNRKISINYRIDSIIINYEGKKGNINLNKLNIDSLCYWVFFSFVYKNIFQFCYYKSTWDFIGFVYFSTVERRGYKYLGMPYVFLDQINQFCVV